MFHFLTMNNFTRRKQAILLYYYSIIIIYIKTKEKERERASLDLRAMRVGDRCHARRSFLFLYTIVLTWWQVDDALFL